MTEDRALRFRSPELVISIVGYFVETDEPIPWLEALEVFVDDEHPWKTVENLFYELVAFGALHRTGKPKGKGRTDSRALRATPLGRAWLERDLLELPGLGEDLDDLAEDLTEDLDVEELLEVVHTLHEGTETDG